MLRKILLIVASGKSTRFGGYPKAFVPIGDKLVVENTVHMAKPMFDEIYIAVNEETYSAYKDKITGCRMFPIVTGNGDARGDRAFFSGTNPILPISGITSCEK